MVELKTKRQGYTSKTKIDSPHQQVPKLFLNLTLTPKIAPTSQKKNNPEGPKKCKKAQNLAELKTKRQGCTSKTKIDSLHQQVPKMYLNLTSTPKIAPKGKKIAPKGPKKCERGPKYECFKNKRQGCTSKTKVDCLYRNVTKKCLNLTPAPKIALKGKKKAKKTPIVAKFKQKIGLYFQNPNLLYTLVGPKN